MPYWDSGIITAVLTSVTSKVTEFRGVMVPEKSGGYGMIRVPETRPKLRIPAGIVKHSMK